MAAMRPPPNNPRQNRIVQESKGRSRVKNGAVLHATAAATTSPMPRRCWDGAPAMIILLVMRPCSIVKRGT
jgi:hypothetical protein